jgi:hypothetical protein
MTRREINLIGGFYKDSSLPWSAQDTVNWLPVPAQEGGTRSPMKLRGAPGLRGVVPPIVESSPLAISGNAPNSSCGAAYSFGYTTENGSPPLNFAVTSGSLPPGLSLNSSTGVISGTVLCGTASEFGEVPSLAEGGDVFTSFITSSFIQLPGSPENQAITGGVQTIVVRFNIGSTPASNSVTFDAYLDGAVVGTTGGISFGVESPNRFFAFDTRASSSFYILPVAGSGTFTGEIYTYAESVETLYPGSGIGVSGGPGTYNFEVTATDAAGRTATISDSIVIAA